jgi:integrase
MNRAGRIKDVFLSLRARAVLCLLRLTGKRRGEIAILSLSNFKVEDNFLNVTFILAKKRKETVLSKTAKKSIPLSDPLTEPIITYLEHLRSLEPFPAYFLPRVRSVFGNNFIVSNSHISGRQVFNIVRSVSDTVWPHLFRETVASDIIKQDNSIIAAFKVQRRLDLESVNTGFNYLRRFSADIIQRQEQQDND